METPVKPPHVARRRAGDNRIVREVDDIIALIQYLDENKLLCSLPIYVSANSDCMPSARLFEGELIHSFIFVYCELSNRSCIQK